MRGALREYIKSGWITREWTDREARRARKFVMEMSSNNESSMRRGDDRRGA